MVEVRLSPGPTYPTASVTGMPRAVTIQYGDTDLELRDLAVKVPRHEPLAQPLDAMRLRHDATAAVISAPSSP